MSFLLYYDFSPSVQRPTVSQYESMRTAAAFLKPTGISASLLDSNQWHNLLHARRYNQALDRSHKVLQYSVHLNIIQVWRRRNTQDSADKKQLCFLSRCVNKRNNMVSHLTVAFRVTIWRFLFFCFFLCTCVSMASYLGC